MIDLKQLSDLCIKSNSKIVVVVMDGLGGLPHPDTIKTELESALTPNMDKLAKDGICGLCNPVSPGITPGSGPGHLALFGYDPLQYDIGRGVLEAMGIDFPITKTDVCARGNFCTIDDNGIITDRRAGRITTDKCRELCNLLSQIQTKNVETFIWPVKEHRFLLVMRNKNLSPCISDSDPQKSGVAPSRSTALSNEARFSADTVNSFIDKASAILVNHRPANMILLRGFSKLPTIPSYEEVFKLNALAIAAYPMYRGLAKLVGMKVADPPQDLNDAVTTLALSFNKFDYFFIHIKSTDSAGEDGDFSRKVNAIEQVDSIIPRIAAARPDVLIITGDHSTPAVLRSHSWHPVPFLLSSKWCRRDNVIQFSETACINGGLGIFQSLDIMPLAMAHALKLAKYGA